jgi:hypothetical protein
MIFNGVILLPGFFKTVTFSVYTHWHNLTAVGRPPIKGDTSYTEDCKTSTDESQNSSLFIGQQMYTYRERLY